MTPTNALTALALLALIGAASAGRPLASDDAGTAVPVLARSNPGWSAPAATAP